MPPIVKTAIFGYGKMIKVRKAGAWSDVTTYKRRTAGVWEWVDLGKRWEPIPSTYEARSSLVFTSGTPTDWETVGTAGASSQAGTMLNTGSYCVPNVTGSYAQGNPANFTNAKYYMEVDIEFTDGGAGEIPVFMRVNGTSSPLDFILMPGGGSLYNLELKNLDTEESQPSTLDIIALNTRYIISVEWDTTTGTAAFYLNGVLQNGVTFASGITAGDIDYIQVGDLDETFAANRFKVYRAEVGIPTNTVPGV